MYSVSHPSPRGAMRYVIRISRKHVLLTQIYITYYYSRGYCQHVMSLLGALLGVLPVTCSNYEMSLVALPNFGNCSLTSFPPHYSTDVMTSKAVDSVRMPLGIMGNTAILFMMLADCFHIESLHKIACRFHHGISFVPIYYCLRNI